MFKNCIKTKEIWSDLATALLTGSQYDQLKFFKAEHTGGTVSSNHFHLPHCRWISNKHLTGAAVNRTFTDGWMFGSVLCFWGKTVSIKTWRWACVRAHASAVGRVNRVWDCSNTPQGTNRTLKSVPQIFSTLWYKWKKEFGQTGTFLHLCPAETPSAGGELI